MSGRSPKGRDDRSVIYAIAHGTLALCKQQMARLLVIIISHLGSSLNRLLVSTEAGPGLQQGTSSSPAEPSSWQGKQKDR